MKFFNRNRRGRSKSVDHNAAKHRSGSRPREQPVARRKMHQRQQRGGDDGSVGSDLPTLDQFEIAVPSKSFASMDLGEHDRIRLPSPESREDRDSENRSTTDISSITSVSYRAGYYYLRNIKNKAPAAKPQSSASCMPSCSCSWLTCCCCAEAQTELAAQKEDTNTAITAPLSKNSLLLDQPRQRNDKARRAQSPGRRAVAPDSNRRRQSRDGKNNRQNSSGRRQNTAEARESPMHTSIQGTHSLFDELSEDEEKAAYGATNRGRQRQQQHQRKPQQQPFQRRSRKKSWLQRRGDFEDEPECAGERKSRSRSRGRVARR